MKTFTPVHVHIFTALLGAGYTRKAYSGSIAHLCFQICIQYALHSKEDAIF